MITNAGLKVKEFKEGCLEITRPNETKPSLLITIESLIDEYVEWTDKTEGMVDEAIQWAFDNGFQE